MHVKVHPVATAAAVAVNLIQHAPASTAWLAVAVAVHAAMVAVAVVDLVAAAAAEVVAQAAAVVAMAVAVAAVAVRSAANQHINNLPFDGRQWPDH